MPLRQHTPAKSLEEIYKTLTPEPLEAGADMEAFYRQELNAVRGGDRVAPIELALNRQFQIGQYKGYFMGHPGVGKSTEINRLVKQIEKNFRVVRLDAYSELDPVAFEPADVLRLILVKMLEALIDLKNKGYLVKEPPASLLKDIRDALSTNGQKQTTSQALTGVVSFAPLLSNVKGELKYALERKSETTQGQWSAIPALLSLTNRLLDNANALLQTEEREWLIIGEDFDKPGISEDCLQTFFIGYANIVTDLKTHLLFNIPIPLVYSEQAARLPNVKRHCIYDTPVYSQDKSVHQAGRDALREILDARIEPTLFQSKQQERLIVASGGNLTDLFAMTGDAADAAALDPESGGKVGERHVTQAIAQRRTSYLNRLGSSPYDKEEISYSQKAERLAEIYHQHEGYDAPDPIMHALLRARAVQEFNTTRWFGVHPLVVDILVQHKRLQPSVGSKVRGGTI